MHHRGRRAEGGGEAAFCPFRRDTPPLHIVSDGVYDRFVFMRVGVSGVLFFCQFALKRIFPKTMGTSATASAAARGSIPPVPARYARSKNYGRRRVRLVGSVSGYGVAWGVEKTNDREIGRGAGLRP